MNIEKYKKIVNVELSLVFLAIHYFITTTITNISLVKEGNYILIVLNLAIIAWITNKLVISYGFLTSLEKEALEK